MPEVGSTWVTVLPDMRRFNTDLSRQATASGDTSGKSFSSTFAKAAAVGLAVFGAARIFGGFIADAQEAAKITRLTENAILATGGAANVTAKQVADLATSLSNKTAIDDELIQSGANLILTFKNIRNEAGAGNDIFNQTTEAALNLSAAGFGSVESASLMLGKALNDPLAGLTALGRAGVTFSEQQKEQIKVLTESGDLLGAQKIILEEVGSQVGGAAEAAADPIERLKVVVGNLGEQFGAVLLPIVEGVSRFFTDTFVPGIQEFIYAFQEGSHEGEGFIGFMSRLGIIARDVFEWIKANVVPVLQDIAGWIVDNVVPALKSMAEFVQRNSDFFIPFAAAIAAIVAVIKVWTVTQVIWNAVMAANPIGLVVVALAALVAALVWAWTNSETFRDVVTGVWDAVSGAFMGAWENVISPVFTWIGEAVGNTVGFFTGMGNTIGSVWQGIQDVLGAGWNWIRDNVFTPFQNIFGTIGDAFATFGGTTAAIWTDIQQIFVEAVNGVIGFINGFLDAINWVGEQVGLDFGLHIGYIPIPGLGPGIAGPSGGLAFAEGGLVPGRGDKDSVAAWLMPEEIVMRKDIAKPFKNFLLALNAGQAEAIQAAGGRGGRGPQRFATGGTVQSAQEWARANSGRPYIWGGVGPAGWDCSGWQSDIANHLLGTPMGVRRFATGSMMGGVNAGGFVRGEDNEYTIGVNTPGLVAAIGHTAGTLGDLNVESGSGHGGIIGGNALGTNSGFAYKYYLPGSYGFNAAMEARAAQQNYTIPMSGGFSPYELFAGIGNWMMDQIATGVEIGADTQWASSGIRADPAPRPFDQGGIWKSGTAGVNLSGRDELVLSPSQTEAYLGGGQIPSIRIWVGDREITDIVKVEIDRSDDRKQVGRRAMQRSAR